MCSINNAMVRCCFGQFTGLLGILGCGIHVDERSLHNIKWVVFNAVAVCSINYLLHFPFVMLFLFIMAISPEDNPSYQMISV